MRLLAVVLALVVSGCALTSKAPAIDVHYFGIDPPGTTTTHAATVTVTAPRTLALGRVRSSAFLRNRIVYREANGMLGEYEQWRWTEYPEVYLRRSLSRGLFEGDRFVESLGGSDVPTLDVELLAFEEVRGEGKRAGRVQVEYRLHAGDRVLASDVVTAEREAPAGGGMIPVVDALEAALVEVTAKLVAVVDTAWER